MEVVLDMQRQVRRNRVYLIGSLVIVLLSNIYLMNLKGLIESNTEFKIFDMRFHYTLNDVKVGLSMLSECIKSQYQVFLIVDLIFFITALLVFQLLLHKSMNTQLYSKMWYKVINGVVIIRMLTDVGENICTLWLLSRVYNQKIASILVKCSEIKIVTAAIWLILVGVGLLILTVKRIKLIKHKSI